MIYSQGSCDETKYWLELAKAIDLIQPESVKERNSSRSIVANYVEGYVRQTTSIKDHRRFMIYSQGSCDETKYWLELAKAIDLEGTKRCRTSLI